MSVPHTAGHLTLRVILTRPYTTFRAAHSVGQPTRNQRRFEYRLYAECGSWYLISQRIYARFVVCVAQHSRRQKCYARCVRAVRTALHIMVNVERLVFR
eukprot:3155491-Rhodomonas_salina.2